jgi:hypothetical protein
MTVFHPALFRINMTNDPAKSLPENQLLQRCLNAVMVHAGFSHLRPRAALYIASITLTRAAASRGVTSGWSF